MRGRLRPSPAMVVAFIALFVAIGGSSYAVTRLPAGSVGSKQLKKNAVTGAKVKNGSLTAADIKVASLAGVASAATAASAANATHAGAAAGLDRVIYVNQPGGRRPGDGRRDRWAGADDHRRLGHLPGRHARGRRRSRRRRLRGHVRRRQLPGAGGRAWTARVDNNDPPRRTHVPRRAVCVAAAAAG